jgi:hypothetical protein
MTVRRREEDGGRRRARAVTARGDENAPLHSPQLTQRRTHPAVIHSTPAGEQQRPRVRRSHEEKTRGQDDCTPTSGLIKRDEISNIGHVTGCQPVDRSSHDFVTVTLATTFEMRDQSGNPILINSLRSRYVPPANGGKTSTCTALLSCCSRSSW